jgi:hypothetical protein
MISFANQRRRWTQGWFTGVIRFGAVSGTLSVSRELKTEIPTEDKVARLKAVATCLMPFDWRSPPRLSLGGVSGVEYAALSASRGAGAGLPPHHPN